MSPSSLQALDWHSLSTSSGEVSTHAVLSMLAGQVDLEIFRVALSVAFIFHGDGKKQEVMDVTCATPQMSRYESLLRSKILVNVVLGM